MPVDIATLGIDLDTRGLNRGRADLKKFHTEADQAALAGAKLGRDLKNAFGALGIGLAIRSIVRNTVEAERETTRLTVALRNNGQALGLTIEELQDYATEMQRVTTFSDDAVLAAQRMFIQLGGVTKETLPRATQAAADLATQFGEELPAAAQMLAKAIKDPEEGLMMLNRQTRLFSEEQRAALKVMVETGQKAQASAFIIQAVEKAYGGAAKAARDDLGGALEALQNQFSDLLEGKGSNVNELKESIDELTETLADPATAEGIRTITAAVLDLVSAVASLVGWLGKLPKNYGGNFAAFMSGETYNPMRLGPLGFFMTPPKSRREVAAEDAMAGRSMRQVAGGDWGFLTQDYTNNATPFFGEARSEYVTTDQVQLPDVETEAEKRARLEREKAMQAEKEAMDAYRDSVAALRAELDPYAAKEAEIQAIRQKNEELFQAGKITNLEYAETVMATNEAMNQLTQTEEEVEESMTSMIAVIQSVAQVAMDELGGTLGQVFSDIRRGTLDLKEAIGDLAESFISAIEQMIAQTIAFYTIQAALGLVGYTVGANGVIAPKPGGAKGGLVVGPGTSTSDSVDARLSDGEFVIQASAVRKYGRDMMEDINARRFASGGYVGGGVSGRSGMTVEIINNGQPARVEKTQMTRTADGRQVMRMWLGPALKDLNENGPFSQLMERTFGLRRASVSR